MFEQYVVTADYQKKNKNDISLTAGDITDVIERNDYGERRKKNDSLFVWFEGPVYFAEPLDKMRFYSCPVFLPSQRGITRIDR